MKPTRKVVIIGGGVAGLTAAHELKERGFSVVVYEREADLGGKARSFLVPEWAHENIVGLPAEHGFRFFPGFYRHLTGTLRRIPFSPGKYVFDNLVDLSTGVFAERDRPFFKFPTERPRSVRQLMRAVRQLFDDPSLGLSVGEASFAVMKLLNAMTMCNERREAELDCITWWDYMRADAFSDAYRTVVVNGLTQNFVAMKAKQSSTKSVINILARLLNNLMTRGSTMDRVLNGPTSDVWITPWVHYLESERGGPPVKFHTNTQVDALIFNSRESRVVGLKLQDDDVGDADACYISAAPVEAMVAILKNTPDILEHDPSLKLLSRLNVNWMSGVMYYLTKFDVPMSRGHVVCLNSNWALTSISQNQFWVRKIDQYGKPKIKGIISVIISDWFAPGNHSGCTAQQSECPGEVAEEALREMQDHLSAMSGIHLDEKNIAGAYVDPALVYHKPLLGLMTAATFAELKRELKPPKVKRSLTKPMIDFIVKDKEPLFINTVNSWACRPTERTGIENLFLASDYIKTNTDLATMEGANEAARRAVNAILDLMGAPQRRCKIFQFDEPAPLAPFKFIDNRLFKLGFPHPSDFVDLFVDFML
jgi:uncharacterized protein with NAD-binding domain and iron-sulfur cluster